MVAAVFYVIAGILHFAHPDVYVRIVPPFVPAHLAMVYLSGMGEIAGGVGLLIPPLQRTAAWGLVGLLVAVFPANVYMAMDRVQVTSHLLSDLLLWARLPLQIVPIWWLLWAVKRNEDAK